MGDYLGGGSLALTENINRCIERVVMDSAIWGLIGTLIGALSSIGTTWLANLNSYKLQESKDLAVQATRAKEFQRDTLLELQEAIHDAFRLIAKAYLEDRKAFAGGGEWGKNMLPVALDEELRFAQRKVAILIERVSNDPLRDAIKATMKRAMNIALADSFNEAETEYLRLISDWNENNERLGCVLRDHF